MSTCDQDVRDAVDLATALAAQRTLQFRISEQDLKQLGGPSSIAAALKAGILYSNKAVIATQSLQYWNAIGSPPSGQRTFWSGHKPEKRLEEILRERLIGLGVPDLEDQPFVLLPEEIYCETEEWEDEDNWVNNGSSRVFELAKQPSNPFTLSLAFSDPAIRSRVGDRRSGQLANIWLPSLENIPLDTLLRLRADEEDAFGRLHFALKQFVDGLGETTSEVALKELFQLVDHEVRSFQVRVGNLRKSSRAALAQVVLGFSVMGAALLIPEDVAKLVSAFVGSSSAKDYVKTVVQNHQRFNDLRASDFYAAWLVARNSESAGS